MYLLFVGVLWWWWGLGAFPPFAMPFVVPPRFPKSSMANSRKRQMIAVVPPPERPEEDTATMVDFTKLYVTSVPPCTHKVGIAEFVHRWSGVVVDVQSIHIIYPKTKGTEFSAFVPVGLSC